MKSKNLHTLNNRSLMSQNSVGLYSKKFEGKTGGQVAENYLVFYVTIYPWLMITRMELNAALILDPYLNVRPSEAWHGECSIGLTNLFRHHKMGYLPKSIKRCHCTVSESRLLTKGRIHNVKLQRI